jgi:intracellular sulfur oxidation DsrE/DsrF family protein
MEAIGNQSGIPDRGDAELIKEGVVIDVCGQHMKRGVLTDRDLLPGVRPVLGGQPRVIDLELRGYA